MASLTAARHLHNDALVGGAGGAGVSERERGGEDCGISCLPFAGSALSLPSRA